MTKGKGATGSYGQRGDIVIKLSCVNCGASLEIGPDLDTFACGYCGSQQRVERKGGVIALQRVETAIRAVQRGTDRVAAELALPRLESELEDLELDCLSELKAAAARRAGAIEFRRNFAFTVLFVVFFGGIYLMNAGEASMRTSPAWLQEVLNIAWMAGCVGVPALVYALVMIPSDEAPKIRASYETRFQQLSAQIDANRDVLDALDGAAIRERG